MNKTLESIEVRTNLLLLIIYYFSSFPTFATVSSHCQYLNNSGQAELKSKFFSNIFDTDNEEDESESHSDRHPLMKDEPAQKLFVQKGLLI